MTSTEPAGGSSDVPQQKSRSNISGLFGADRWRHGVRAVAIGVIALVVAYVAALFLGSGLDTSDAITGLGVIASPIVAIVSAYFGIQATQGAAAATVEAAKNVGQAERKASDAEIRAEHSQIAAQSAVERLNDAEQHGADEARKKFREPTLRRLEQLAQSDPSTEAGWAQGQAAVVWDDILKDVGAIDPELEHPDPSSEGLA